MQSMNFIGQILFLMLGVVISLQAVPPVPYSGKVAINGVNYHGEAKFAFSLLDTNRTVHWKSGVLRNESIKVLVTNGRYKVLLGGQGMNSLSPELFLRYDELFLKVEFDNGDGKGLRHLAPDQLITASPRALVAEYARNSGFAKVAEKVRDGAITPEMLNQETITQLGNNSIVPDQRSITREMIAPDFLAEISQNSNMTSEHISVLKEYFEPKFESFPTSTTVLEGHHIALEIPLKNDENSRRNLEYSFKLYKDGNRIANYNRNRTWDDLDENVTLSDFIEFTTWPIEYTQKGIILNIFQMSQFYEGNYTIVASNEWGETSVEFELKNKIPDEVLLSETVLQIIHNSDGSKFTGLRGQDFHVRKTDVNNSIIWEKTYGGSSSDELVKIIKNYDGTLFLAGNSRSPADGNKTQDSRGGEDFWIIKIDENGTKLWDKRFGGVGYDELQGGCVSNSGDILLFGSFGLGLQGIDNSDRDAYTSNGTVWIICIDENGTKKWDTARQDSYLRAAAIGDDEFVVCRSYQYYPSNGGGYVSYPDINKSLYLGGRNRVYESIVQKLDNDGNQVWRRSIDNLRVVEIITSADGQIVIGGTIYSGSDYDFYLAKFDLAGNMIWERSFGDGKAQLQGFREYQTPSTHQLTHNGNNIPVFEVNYLLYGASSYSESNGRLGTLLIRTDGIGTIQNQKVLISYRNEDGASDVLAYGYQLFGSNYIDSLHSHSYTLQRWHDIITSINPNGQILIGFHYNKFPITFSSLTTEFRIFKLSNVLQFY